MSPTVQHLIPKLRFSEFSGNWQKMKLGDIASFEQGIQVDIEEQCNEPKEGYTKFLRIENYTQNSQDFRYIPNKNLRDKQLVEDEVVAVRYGATAGFIGKGFSGVLANNLFKINAEPYISNIFLYIQLKKEETFAWMQAQMAGGAMPALNFGIMKVLPISFPSLPEQTKIASFLSAVDEKIQQLTDLKSAREQYKTGMMQQIFSQHIRFRDENGNDFPEWEEKKLGEFLIQKSTRNKNYKINLVLSVNNKKGFVTQNEQFEGHQVASSDLINYKIVSKGDFAYNPSRINVGSIARLINFECGIVSPMYVVFMLKEGLNNIFFENLYSTHRFKHLIKIGCSGSVRDSLNFEDMAGFNISVPSLPEQDKIANFLVQIDVKITEYTYQIEQTKQWKKGLLQGLFI